MTFAATDIIILICLAIIALAAVSELCIFARHYPKTFAAIVLAAFILYKLAS